MEMHNLYLNQISCLESPANNKNWHDIIHCSPFASHCLSEATEFVEKAEKSLSSENLAIQSNQETHQGSVDEPIPWCTADRQHFDEENKPIMMKRFIYDCSYLSPFVSNLYTREQSDQGWYRWVGPDPYLEVRIPIARVESEHWLFTATFHAFVDESHAKCIVFEVDNQQKPLEWIEGSTYQSKISSSELYANTHPNSPAVLSMSIAVPGAHRASEQDQRILAFAIRRLSLTPA
jgi:hypothetical protein